MTADHILLGVNVDHVATVRQARYRHNTLDHGDEVEPDCVAFALASDCLLYTSPSPRDRLLSRMPSSA